MPARAWRACGSHAPLANAGICPEVRVVARNCRYRTEPRKRRHGAKSPKCPVIPGNARDGAEARIRWNRPEGPECPVKTWNRGQTAGAGKRTAHRRSLADRHPLHLQTERPCSRLRCPAWECENPRGAGPGGKMTSCSTSTGRWYSPAAARIRRRCRNRSQRC
jgi:hypothetical protein